MLPFLMQEGVSEVLINFITRLDPTLLPQPSSTPTPEGILLFFSIFHFRRK